MSEYIEYTCPLNITSFEQCSFPKGVTSVNCEFNGIESFKYLPDTVEIILCGHNNIKSFKHTPKKLRIVHCEHNQIESYKFLPNSVTQIYCNNNNIKSWQYLPENIIYIRSFDNPCSFNFGTQQLDQIHQENKDMLARYLSRWKSGIENLRYMRLNYIVHNLWKRYWYDQRDVYGYSRACKYLASKSCPNGVLMMK